MQALSQWSKSLLINIYKTASSFTFLCISRRGGVA